MLRYVGSVVRSAASSLALFSLCACGTGVTVMPVPGVPYVDWVMPRVPIGAPTFELHGSTLDPTMMVEVHIGGMVLMAPATAVDAATILVSPPWPAATPPGEATVIVNNPQGASVPASFTLVELGFGPADPSPGTLSLSDPSWLQRGLLQGASQLFVFTPPALQYLDYNGGTGLFGSTVGNVSSGLALAAPADLDGDNTTDFVVADTANNLNVCRYSGGYACSAITPPWTGGLAAVAAGATTRNRESIAVCDQSANLYQCFYQRSPALALPCVEVKTLPMAARSLLVQALSPSGQADIVVLDRSGALTLWRSDQTDTFSQCTDCFEMAVQTRSFNAMALAELDGKNGVDLVAVDDQGIAVLLNDGQGKFQAVNNTAASLPKAPQLALGDVDKDGKPDLVLTDASTGIVTVWLNQSDGAAGDGKLAGPVPAPNASSGQPIVVPASGAVGLDGSRATDSAQRLITTDLAAKKLVSWPNLTLP